MFPSIGFSLAKETFTKLFIFWNGSLLFILKQIMILETNICWRNYRLVVSKDDYKKGGMATVIRNDARYQAKVLGFFQIL